MINLQQVIDFAHSQGFINENEKQQLINEQLALYNNLEKLKEYKWEKREGYTLHYNSKNIYCECSICKRKSFNFYEIYEPSVHLNCEPQLYTDPYKDKYYICNTCMQKDEIRTRFL